MLARIARDAHTLHRSLLDLLFPPGCVICRRPGEWLCATCCSHIEPIRPPLCDRCGRPLRHGECPHCREFPLVIDGLRAVAFFEGVMREAIHSFKYRQRPQLAVPFGTLLHNYIREFSMPFDVIVPVPLHRRRERSRGYNQSMLLAREVAARQKLCLWYNVLERTRDTPPQVELDAPARKQNVHGAFAATDRVAGARVLLIDDVCTTGATMDACSAALKARGANSVWGLALARGR